MQKNHIVLAVAVIMSAMLACNLPSNTPNQPNPDAVLTAAALTVQAQLTTSAPTVSPANSATSAPSAGTPTFTPVPLSISTSSIPSATATSNCDSAQFVADVSYPDNTSVPAGTVFNKIWKLKNTGTCTWTPSYAIVFSSGEQMGGPTTQALTGNVNPGETYDVSIVLTAPSTAGTHTGYWILRNASGITFHSNFYVQIKVTGGGGGGGSGPFAVTSVSFNVTGSCGNFHITANIITNGAGTVKYHRIWSDGGTDSLPGTLIYSAAGTNSVTYDSSTSSSGWMDIYIDSPNHQQFGRATYPCP
jgi:Ig-like domain from next to BRCA1 gene